MQGENATIAHFKPIETYAERFEEILRDIQALGFTALDVWLGHLGPAWASQAHIQIARRLLAKYNLRPVSLAGWFGATAAEFERSCQLAAALEAPLLGGVTSLLETDRAAMVKLLKQYGIKFALENHPEKTPDEILARIGDGGEGTIGATVDTGWFGTQGYDAAAIERLGDRIFHVHLNDVLELNRHATCRYGAGIVPIEKCVRTLQRIGYSGAITVEHEPETFDPTEDIKANLAMLREWLA